MAATAFEPFKVQRFPGVKLALILRFDDELHQLAKAVGQLMGEPAIVIRVQRHAKEPAVIEPHVHSLPIITEDVKNRQRVCRE
ncbi:MAG: hypothetical protein M3478_09505 [Planctomycetota bacterium]|nr:hypothetical protein [Planctomycetota bacterium]